MGPRHIDAQQSILVLQFDTIDPRFVHEHFSMDGFLASLIASVVVGARGRRDWVFFLATDQLHVEGLSTWFGMSRTVPLAEVALLQKLLEAAGARVQREHANLAHHAFRPLLAIDGQRLEVPLVTELDDRDLDPKDFGVTAIVHRSFALA